MYGKGKKGELEGMMYYKELLSPPSLPINLYS
jgi:hypothetical protein